MDQKALASPELRTQHILSLHQELLESKIQTATLEQALVRVGRLDMEQWEGSGEERSRRQGTKRGALLLFFVFVFASYYNHDLCKLLYIRVDFIYALLFFFCRDRP